MAARRALYLVAFLRALSTGAVGVLLGVYLARLALSGTAIGIVVSTGLAGSAVASMVATLFGDRIGRRRLLVVVSALGVAGTAGAVFAERPALLALFAFFGMLNGMGKDRGAALILEQAALPATTTEDNRTRVIAWYTMLQDIGHALGALVAAVPSLIAHAQPELQPATPHRIVLGSTALLGLVAIVVYLQLGSILEPATKLSARNVSPRTKSILVRLCALFSIDSLAGGFLTTSLLSYFFFERFHASEALIGMLFFGARLMNAASHLAAAWLAKRIGLVNTMVFTHIPSSLLLVTVAFAPSLPVAALLFLLREGLVEMDVPTRQSYVLAVVEPEARTFASGVTNLVRVASWAVAPAFAGAMMAGDALYLPLVIGAAMKITYDILLWRAFRSIRPPEEMQAA